MAEFESSATEKLVDKNCIGYAFYKAGIDETEQFREPGKIETYSRRLKREGTQKEARLIGIEDRLSPGNIVHLMAIDLEDPNFVVEREMTGGERSKKAGY